MSKQEKIQEKYRIAERMRKERERAEDAAREQGFKDDTRNAMRRAHSAEQQYEGVMRQTQVLPNDHLEKVVSHMLYRMVIEMADRAHAGPIVAAFLEHTIIRTGEHLRHRHNPIGVEVLVCNDTYEDDPTITITIPEMRLTNILDKNLLEAVTGKRGGPVIMEDRPLYTTSLADSCISEADPDAPVSDAVVTII